MLCNGAGVEKRRAYSLFPGCSWITHYPDIDQLNVCKNLDDRWRYEPFPRAILIRYSVVILPHPEVRNRPHHCPVLEKLIEPFGPHSPPHCSGPQDDWLHRRRCARHGGRPWLRLQLNGMRLKAALGRPGRTGYVSPRWRSTIHHGSSVRRRNSATLPRSSCNTRGCESPMFVVSLGSFSRS
jgi:hypothetical protein